MMAPNSTDGLFSSSCPTGEPRRKGYAGPIVALTAHAMAEDRDKCLRAGCSDYLSKPVPKDKLLETVRRHLDSQGRAAAGEAGAAAGDASPAAAVDPAAGPLRSTIADDPDVGQFLSDYVNHLPAMVGELTKQMDRQDLEQLGRVIHQLKGTGGLYGFATITDSATAAERTIRQGEPLEEVRRQVESLVALVRRVESYSPDAEGEPAAAAKEA